jgi:16S rRNA (guanine1207-N2)-methyltransferase
MPALSLDDYYRWREFEARLGGQHIRYAAKPGLPDWDVPDHAARLLANSIEVGQGDQIVDLRSGKGILAAILARRGAQVTVQEDHIVAAEATRRTLALNDVSASSDRPPDYGVAV